MATEIQMGDWCAEILRMAAQTHGENELLDLKDVHWDALTMLDKLHNRDRRTREKEIAENAKEPSKGPTRVTPQIWQSNHGPAHVNEQQEAGSPWELPGHEKTSELPLLNVDGLAGFTAVVSSFKPKTGIGVDPIHPSMWSHISEEWQTAVL